MNWLWLKDRAVNCAIYGTIILAVGLGLYKLFIKDTNKTTYRADEIRQYYPDAKFTTFGCALIKADKPKTN